MIFRCPNIESHYGTSFQLTLKEEPDLTMGVLGFEDSIRKCKFSFAFQLVPP